MIREEIALMRIATKSAPHSHSVIEWDLKCVCVCVWSDHLPRSFGLVSILLMSQTFLPKSMEQSTRVQCVSCKWVEKRRKLLYEKEICVKTNSVECFPERYAVRLKFAIWTRGAEKDVDAWAISVITLFIAVSWVDSLKMVLRQSIASSNIQFILNCGDRRRVPSKTSDKSFRIYFRHRWKRRQRDDDMESVSVSSSTASRLFSLWMKNKTIDTWMRLNRNVQQPETV